MEETPKPRRRWKILGIIGGAVAAMVVVWAVVVNIVAHKRSRAADARTRELLAEAKARPSARPVLRGEAVPGNAWEDYQPALDEMEAAGKAKDDPRLKLADFVDRSRKADRAAVEALVAKHAAALDRLRKGVQRAEAQYPCEWEKGFAAPIPGLLASQMLANLAVCKARLLTEAGQHAEAARLLLDIGRFAGDMGHNGTLISAMMGLALHALALDDLHDLLLSGKLNKEDLAEVERELEILDRSFPSLGPVYLNERMSVGFTVLKSDFSFESQKLMGSLASLGDSLGAWRYGFSLRLEMAAGLDQLDGMMKRASAASTGPWAGVLAVTEEIRIECEASRNRLVKLGGPGMMHAERAVRERRAQLRLLRVAVHYLATGEVSELDDPFGAKLLHSKDGGKLKVWSLGRDGTDNKGKGGWKPDSTDGTDIALEIGP